MKFIEAFKRRQNERKASGISRYRQLIVQAAKAGELNAKDQAELENLAEQNGIDGEQMEADAGAIVAYNTALATVKNGVRKRNEYQAARQALSDHDGETAEMIVRRQGERAEREKAKVQSEFELQSVNLARETIDNLIVKHRNLLAGMDAPPADETKAQTAHA